MNNIMQMNPIIRIINEKAELRKDKSELGLSVNSLYLMKKTNYKMLNKKKMIISS